MMERLTTLEKGCINMLRLDAAVKWQLQIANNPAHGYDQIHRWGPNFDCSSFIIQAWENAGVPVKTDGATYTGNMRKVFLRNGFILAPNVNLQTVTGLVRGDILLSETGKHVATYLGSGRIVHASLNEKGTITGGVSGDQNGREIYERNYYNHPWTHVLRYVAGTSTPVKPAEFVIGRDYTVLVNGLNVRVCPGLNCRRLAKNELTPSGQKQSNSKGQLNAGTIVTVKEVSISEGNTWVRTPSGWLCAIFNGERYIG